MALTVRFISRRLWQPFDRTLCLIEGFRLENGRVPDFPESNVTEFVRLDSTLRTLMHNSLASYNMQKEFTENASHELQTPLAVFQSKLDLLLQSPDLTKRQAVQIQGLYETASRLARMNRNLLLLAKIDNRQYEQMEDIELTGFIGEMLPSLEFLADDIAISKEFAGAFSVWANRTLLECLVNNLVVNAVRHNRDGGEISISVGGNSLVVANTSDDPPLDGRLVFNRFYRPGNKPKGNGLGLAIVKAVCDYHGWTVEYAYKDGLHCFTVGF